VGCDRAREDTHPRRGLGRDDCAQDLDVSTIERDRREEGAVACYEDAVEHGYRIDIYAWPKNAPDADEQFRD
jgi:hypothetical protein